MNSIEMEDAIIEITLDKMKGSKLRKKHPKEYNRLISQVQKIKDEGNIVDVPPEIP